MSRLAPRFDLKLLGATALLASLATASHATVFNFDTSPFAGTTALQTPGRQIIGNELFIPKINLATDVFAVDHAVFGIASDKVSFANSLASNLVSGANVIVLQDLDAGGGSKASGNFQAAGTAANLIANSGKESGPGLFVYFNSALNVSRLVFDTDLGSTTSDLKVLARFTGEVGQAGISDLPKFTSSNFDLAAAVPEPASVALIAAGMVGLVLLRRRKPAAAGGIPALAPTESR
ncbi:MAG TPA: PEP-CTERM sorting domain-containing protein [Acetobacteraceae bacterium]|nr:PEP-CTERM sorting domain-containing protein [Acetobacteraceae bacterium]